MSHFVVFVLLPFNLKDPSLSMTSDKISAMPNPNYFPWKHSEKNDHPADCS
jgi:hypothetical protein